MFLVSIAMNQSLVIAFRLDFANAKLFLKPELHVTGHSLEIAET